MIVRLDAAQLKQLKDADKSSGYRFRAWLAIVCLILFFLFYISLASWFTFIAYRLISGVTAGGSGAVAAFFAALPAAFFAIFMWKALIFLRLTNKRIGVEIKPADQPELFSFLHQLADQLGAPRVHRVFITQEVNASVLYDLSIWNLIIPTKKNLTIGLGLVNTLNRAEFTAVIAHEFGHFAQGSMAVGQWASIGQQIASHLISARDWLDKSLQFIASIDLRVAWIGWTMQTIVWAIRSVIETAFKIVMRAQFALSREMEFQADRVAVSIAGSDAIVQALYRLGPADEDWNQTVDFFIRQLEAGKRVRDLYVIHSRIAAHMRMLTDDPTRGQSPPATRERVFEERLAQPPRMWSTHPANTDREVNAKRIYVSSIQDDRPAWTFFRDAEKLRLDIGDFLIKDFKFKEPPVNLTNEEALRLLDAEAFIPIHDPKYRGTYVNRRLSQSAKTVDQMVGELPDSSSIANQLSTLYSEELHQAVMLHRNLNEEIALLESLQNGILEAPGGVIRHRGETLRPSQLQEVIERVKSERNVVLAKIEEHDRACRAVHLAAAKAIGNGWEEYTRNLLSLLHYAEHAQEDVSDALGALFNQLSFQTATGKLWRSGRNKVILAAEVVHAALKEFEMNVAKVELPAAILEELKISTWREATNKYELPGPTDENLHQWIPVIQSWANPVIQAGMALRKATVSELLRTEDRIEDYWLGRAEPVQAPARFAVPTNYKLRLRGLERARIRKLNQFSRFVVADGTLPALARFAVTTSIVFAVATAGFFIGNETIIVYNGLGTPVHVTLDKEKIVVMPNRHRSLSVGMRLKGKIEARTESGELIEQFEPALGRGFATYVYNVAEAWPMVQWTAVYGNATPVPQRNLGCKQWLIASADCLFEQPPNTVSTKGGGATRTVLEAAPSLNPLVLFNLVPNEEEQKRMTRVHAMWDPSEARHTLQWLSIAEDQGILPEVIETRLKRNTYDVAARRFQFDAAKKSEKASVIQAIEKLEPTEKTAGDIEYLKLRMQDDSDDNDQQFIKASRKWPDNMWLKHGAAMSLNRQGELDSAMAEFENSVRQHNSLKDVAALELARLRRFTSNDQQASLADLKDTMPVMIYEAAESGKDIQGTPFYGFYLLSQGSVAQARELAKLRDEKNLLTLCAVSTGAEAQWLDEILAVPPAELPQELLRYLLAAAAAKRGLPIDPYFEFPEDSEPRYSDLFREKLRKWLSISPQQLVQTYSQENFKGLPLVERGILMQTWLIYAPELASTRTRDAVNTILFIAERGYFAPGP